MALDLEALLAPFDGETQVGEDLRADYNPNSVYYRLRDARSDARAAERAADADPSLEADTLQHWRDVLKLSQSALSKSHDLEVAAWATEALVRENGVAGLAEGAALIEGLARGFWENLYPMPDEDGMETRVAPVGGLNGLGSDGTLIQPLRKLPLFARPDGTPLMLYEYQQAEETAAIGDENRKAARLEAGALDLAEVETEARVAGVAHFAALARATEAALDAWRAMGSTLDEMAGADSPPTSRVAEILEQIIATAKRYAPDTSDAETSEDGAEGEAGAEAAQGGGSAGVGGMGPAQKKAYTREDALRQLGEIADFFRRTEPQSPIPLTLDELGRRARMSWSELLEEIQTDESVRQAMLTALGIKPPSGYE